MPQSKVYGTADPVFTGTLSGFLAGDGVTSNILAVPLAKASLAGRTRSVPASARRTC